MNINNNDTAVVVIDPQNDVLSETGVSWDLVDASTHCDKNTAALANGRTIDSFKLRLK